ncbi:GntR family transcriptional regulator [Amycolatopsis pigmentata]|uniref:GntR family transcriptional regulator n=1 Tax=Amycolatopsis pigmentata TaxID=450801 RepID=A0ABW5FQS7_9PSEU
MADRLYQELRDKLEQQIRSGALPPGSKLPTEAQLQQEHGVSRGTAQRALDELARSGLVLRRRRHGTVVVDQKRQENLLRFTDPLVSSPMIPGRHVVVTASVIPASEVPFEMPGIEPETPVVFLGRQKLDADEKPVGMEWSAIPFALAPHLLDEDLAELRVLSYFQRTGLRVEKTRLYLDPVIVDEETARLTGCPAGIPALRRRRYTWLEDGRLVEAGSYFTRPDVMEFYVEQTVKME